MRTRRWFAYAEQSMYCHFTSRTTSRLMACMYCHFVRRLCTGWHVKWN